MSVQKRREELTTLNLLFCLMVLWSHCSGHPITVLDHSSWQYGLMISLQRLTFVSVSGFFFLSGVKLTLNSASAPPPPLGRYWAKRWKGIFLPYLLAVAVYYVYFVSHGYFSFSLRDLAGYMIRGDLSSPFYFVIALAQFVLLLPLFRWLPRRWSPSVLLPISLGITWLSALYCNEILGLLIPGAHFSYNDRLFTTYLVYYVGGCCAGQNYPRFLELLDRNRPLLTACALIYAGATPCTSSPLSPPCMPWWCAIRSPCPPWPGGWTGPAFWSICTTPWSSPGSMTWLGSLGSVGCPSSFCCGWSLSTPLPFWALWLGNGCSHGRGVPSLSKYKIQRILP